MTVSYARRRSAFTLVEMLVATALIIFMMYVIASAFEKGLGSFRVLKTQGDMQEKLRSATTAIRLDLTASHFGDGEALSNKRLNQDAWTGPPNRGYFRISQPANPGVLEGMDPDGFGLGYFRLDPSNVSNPAVQLNDLYLQFTANLSEGHPSLRDARGRRDQYYTTDTWGSSTPLNAYSTPDYNRGDPSMPTVLSSYWAEITYFLKPNGQFTSAGATLDGIGGSVAPLPLYTLYRRQKLLVDVPESQAAPTSNSIAGLTDVSWWNQSGMKLNRPWDITQPFRRLGMTPSGPGCEAGIPAAAAGGFTTIAAEGDAARMGGDVLLTDVVNFEVKVLYDPVTIGDPNAVRFKNTGDAAYNFVGPSNTGNPDYPFGSLPKGVNPILGALGKRIFDTWALNRDSTTGTQPYSINPSSPDPNVDPWNAGHFIPPSAGTTATANTIPLRVRVRGIQVKIRIWDQKTSQTRQITIIQDL